MSEPVFDDRLIERIYERLREVTDGCTLKDLWETAYEHGTKDRRNKLHAIQVFGEFFEHNLQHYFKADKKKNNNVDRYGYEPWSPTDEQNIIQNKYKKKFVRVKLTSYPFPNCFAFNCLNFEQYYKCYENIEKRYGCILITTNLQKILTILPKGSKNYSFPKGQRSPYYPDDKCIFGSNKMEEAREVAFRETLEETGLQPEDFQEFSIPTATIQINHYFNTCTFFVVVVPDEYPENELKPPKLSASQAREVKKVQWIYVSDITIRGSDKHKYYRDNNYSFTKKSFPECKTPGQHAMLHQQLGLSRIFEAVWPKLQNIIDKSNIRMKLDDIVPRHCIWKTQNRPGSCSRPLHYHDTHQSNLHSYNYDHPELLGSGSTTRLGACQQGVQGSGSSHHHNTHLCNINSSHYNAYQQQSQATGPPSCSNAHQQKPQGAITPSLTNALQRISQGTRPLTHLKSHQQKSQGTGKLSHLKAQQQSSQRVKPSFPSNAQQQKSQGTGLSTRYSAKQQNSQRAGLPSRPGTSSQVYEWERSSPVDGAHHHNSQCAGPPPHSNAHHQNSQCAGTPPHSNAHQHNSQCAGPPPHLKAYQQIFLDDGPPVRSNAYQQNSQDSILSSHSGRNQQSSQGSGLSSRSGTNRQSSCDEENFLQFTAVRPSLPPQRHHRNLDDSI